MEFLFIPIRWIRNHPETWGWIALASVGFGVIYAGILSLAVTRMSPDYFSSSRPAPGSLRKRHPVLTVVVKTSKTVLGLVLLSAGIGMLVLPGQGLATIAVAVTFLEFPGKKRLLSAVLFHTGAFRTLNRIRERAGKEPLREPGRKT